MVAEEFEGVASFGEREPLRDQPLEFDRADFRAILFCLRTPPRSFVVVEFAVNALRLAMKEIDEGRRSGRSASRRVSRKRLDKASTADSSAMDAASDEGRGARIAGPPRS